jgi:hypothetical protein
MSAFSSFCRAEKYIAACFSVLQRTILQTIPTYSCSANNWIVLPFPANISLSLSDFVAVNKNN